jgi:hypothetical protein
MASSLSQSGWLPERLADVRIWDVRESGNLFRGQITSLRASVEGVRRTMTIEAESYDRILDYALVGTGLVEFQHFTMTLVPYEQQDETHTPWAISSDPPWYADPYADTGIALPLLDDASVVRALLAHYWTGPELSFDVTSYGQVDAGGAAMDETHPSAEGRTYFGMTTLRDALDKTAALVSSNLSFWIDADLVFHWKVLVGTTWSGSTALPTGSSLHRLGRMLPEWRQTTLAPYDMLAGGANSITGTIALDVAQANAVDRVYIRAGTEVASDWKYLSVSSNRGTALYASAPWAIEYGSAGDALLWSQAEYERRFTYAIEATGTWFGIHVGQAMTIYAPVLGVNSATTQILQTVGVRFGPDGDRTYSLQLGDAAIRTLTAYASRSRAPRTESETKAQWPTKFGANMGAGWTIYLADVMPAPGQQQVVYAQYADAAGAALTIPGLRLQWSLILVNGSTTTTVAYTDVTNIANAWYLAVGESLTAADGRASNLLSANGTATANDVCVIKVDLAPNNAPPIRDR